MKNKMTILVSGMIASDLGQGGAAWAVLQYVLGFERLGYDVYFVEPMQPQAIRPVGSAFAASANAHYFQQVTADFALERRSAFLLAGTQQTVGLPYDQLRQVVRQAHVLINISGLLTDEALIHSIPTRVYVDLDPAFNQLWNAVLGIDMRFNGHTHFVTIGQAIGTPDCTVPTCGRNWLKTWPPIVLDRWPKSDPITYQALTTIANWRGYGSIEHQGVRYGQKAHSLREYISLPAMAREQFALALAIHPYETLDLIALAQHGWRLLDPACVANTPANYQRFIQGSKAEFGIAKSGYVISRCGWFSDRSVCYLASGRPVIAQETGFSQYLPTREGLFAFNHTQEVLQAIEAMRTDYARHAQKARTIAEEYFDSNKVLVQLLEKVGI